MEEIGRAKAPWHLWAIGIAILLWNAVAAFNYVMTQTRNESYMASFTPAQLEYFYGFPTWVDATWAIAVWGGVLAAAALLARSRFAVPLFIASFAAMLVTAFYNYLLSNGLELMGTGGAIFSAVIFVIALLMIFYARAMSAVGQLR